MGKDRIWKEGNLKYIDISCRSSIKKKKIKKKVPWKPRRRKASKRWGTKLVTINETNRFTFIAYLLEYQNLPPLIHKFVLKLDSLFS